jgi:threonine aldolase
MTAAFIDLRSDTVTRPTPAMRAYMAKAEVGDDVFDEDPTIHELQNKTAAYFGKEASLFVPSGTMSNQIAIRAQTQPGDELLCETTSHIYVWEAGGPAALSGVTCRPIDGDYGILDVSQLRDKLRPVNEHYTRSRMVCLENTHNRGGGRVYPLAKIAAIAGWAKSNNLLMHLDGARIWNAIVAAGVSGKEWAKHFDSISVCFSKGLGAPVGSCLVGSKELICHAHKIRKLFGGGMRQAGIIAAGALFALENHVERLAEDHRNAKIIAAAIADSHGVQLDPENVETNLVWFDVDPELGTARDVQQLLQQHGVLVSSTGTQVCRACTHLDVSTAQIEQAAEAIRKALRSPIATKRKSSPAHAAMPGSD